MIKVPVTVWVALSGLDCGDGFNSSSMSNSNSDNSLKYMFMHGIEI